MYKLPVPLHYVHGWKRVNQPAPYLTQDDHYLIAICVVGIALLAVLIHFA